MDVEFQASDFSKLMFKVLDMPDKADPVKQFPKLEKWPQFTEKTGWSILFKNRVFKYIVLMYDKESPFREKFPNLLRRKMEVAKFSKLVENPKMIPEEVNKLFMGKDAKFNAMVVAYVRMHRDAKYSLVFGLDNMYYTDLEKIQNGGKPSREIEITAAQLEKAKADLLNGDDSPQLTEELFAQMEEDRLSNYRPEGIAKTLAAGEDPFEGKEYDSETY